MTQEGIDIHPDPIPGSSENPITNTHFSLPLHNERFVPGKYLTTKTKPQELGHLLEFYESLCAYNKIEDTSEKCNGLIGYCTPEMAKVVETFPSFVGGDFKRMVPDLYDFLRDEDNTDNLPEIDSFTQKWRKRVVGSLKHINYCCRKFLRLVGQVIGAGIIDQEE